MLASSSLIRLCALCAAFLRAFGVRARRKRTPSVHLSQTDPVGPPSSDHDIVARVLADLPEHERNIFLMSQVDGLSYREIARLCGLSQRAVRRAMMNVIAAIDAAFRVRGQP